VLVAAGDPPQYELAHMAQRIVTWYAGRGWTLWLLLLALPCAVAATGVTLLRSWYDDVVLPHATSPSSVTIPAPLATLVVAWATLTSAGIVVIVVLHMLAN
jgi:hypothetical protein